MLDLVVNYWGRVISALITGGPAGYYFEAHCVAEAKAAEEARRAAEAKAAEEARRAAEASPHLHLRSTIQSLAAMLS